MSELPNQTQNHIATSNNQLNKLRAAVLGANDGIVSTAGLVLGVTGASASKETILLAGFAGLVSGALSMAAGEFVSVSSQRDSERAFLGRTRSHIKREHNSSEAEELTELYVAKGFSLATASSAVKDLENSGKLSHELETELGVDSEDVANPWSAAIASAVSFVAGAIIPLAAIALSSEKAQTMVTAIAVAFNLVLTGTLSARAGQANKLRAALRVVVWGIGAMAITYAIGLAVGGVSLG